MYIAKNRINIEEGTRPYKDKFLVENPARLAISNVHSPENRMKIGEGTMAHISPKYYWKIWPE